MLYVLSKINNIFETIHRIEEKQDNQKKCVEKLNELEDSINRLLQRSFQGFENAFHQNSLNRKSPSVEELKIITSSLEHVLNNTNYLKKISKDHYQNISELRILDVCFHIFKRNQNSESLQELIRLFPEIFTTPSVYTVDWVTENYEDPFLADFIKSTMKDWSSYFPHIKDYK